MYDHITHPAKRAFLAAYSASGNVSAAAAIAGVSRELHYDWKAADRDYALALVDAGERAADALEDLAFERAQTGGNDKLLMFLLRGIRRERYGNKLDSTLKAEVNHAFVDLTALNDSDLHELHRLLAKADAAASASGAGPALALPAPEPPGGVLPL